MKLYLRTKDFSFSQEEFDLLHDTENDVLITSPKPDNLEAYYNNPGYISHTDSNRTFFEKVYQNVKKFNLTRKLALINSLNKNEKTLLDIGSGTGDFLVVAKSKGWKVFGIEPNANARQRSRKKGIEVASELENFHNEKFQTITLWHVLEHFSDLKNSIAKISTLLEHGGTLIVAVPNFKSYDAQYYNTYWAAFDVPRHVWHFSKKGIESIFAEYGFTLVTTKPMWFDAFYVSILSEKYKQNKLGFIKGIWVGAYSNFRAMFSGEYSSLIYVLKRE